MRRREVTYSCSCESVLKEGEAPSSLHAFAQVEKLLFLATRVKRNDDTTVWNVKYVKIREKRVVYPQKRHLVPEKP